jgi:hypothetical protein
MKKWIFGLSLALVFMTPACSITNYDNNEVVTFHDTVCIKPHRAYHYMTCSPITVTIDDFIVVIPRDFDTDLASIPRWLWPVIAPSRSDFIPPSILHDYLYTCHNGYERKDIDRIFYNALLANGVSRLRAFEMYAAVRMFGDSHFNEEGSCQERLMQITRKYGSCKDKDVTVS